MARKRRSYRRKRSRNFVAIPFNTSVSIASLADDTVVKGNLLGSNFGEDFYVLSVDATWVRKATSGEGPIQVGLAHGDLTVSEIKENLQAELTDPDDIIAKEHARRPVRTAGGFSGLDANEKLNNGNPIRSKCKFSVGNDHNLAAWAYNVSGAGLAAGGAIDVFGTIYGRWQR